MKKLISLFMMLLIIQIPVFVSAQSAIINHQISGQDQINGVVAEDDTLTLTALVSLVGDTQITPDQLWLGFTTPFDQCQQNADGNWACSLTYPKSTTQQFLNEFPYDINLHSDNHATPIPSAYSIVDSVSGTLVVDKHPPRLQFSVSQTKVQEELSISFTTHDDGHSVGNSNLCAGLKSVVISTPQGEISETYTYDVNDCSAQESKTINVSNIAEGAYDLSAVATDYLDQSTTQTIQIEIDRTGASFSGLDIVDTQGNDIQYIGNAPLQASVILEVSTDTLSNTVIANLQSLNDKQNYQALQGNCNTVGTEQVCQWNIEIVPTAYGNKQITFSGADALGNENTQSFTIPIQQDIEGPRALQFQTQIQSPNNQLFLGALNNTISVQFTESGSGLNAQNVYLDLSDLGGPNKLAATECSAGWICHWRGLDLSVRDDTYEIAIHPDTADNLANKLKQGSVNLAEFIVDSQAPQLLDVEIESLGGGLTHYDGFATLGDSLEIIATLYEPGEITDAYADLSVIVEDAYIVQADNCRHLGQGEWECTWVTDPIDIPGFIRDDITLSFEDFQQNTQQFETQVTVYDVETSFTDYWTHRVECAPNELDREVTSLVEQRIYCHIPLQGSVNIIDMNLGDCQGNTNVTRLIDDAELINSEDGSTDPYIKFSLKPAEIEVESFTVSCPLIITSATERSVTSIPEIENIQIDLPFYNSPLGEYGENTKEKIEDAVDDATKGIWKFVTTMDKIFFYAERICSLITTINTVASIFNVLGAFKKDTAQLMKAINPAVGQGVEQSGVADLSLSSALNNKFRTGWIGKEGGKGWHNAVNKFCKFISCRLYYDDLGWGGGEGIGKSLGSWQRGVLGFFNTVAIGGPAGEAIGLGGQGVNAYTVEGVDERGGVSAKLLLQGGRLNPKDSLVISVATLCIPGIIHHANKYRQIKCLYADCLQTSPETGIPISVCENIKEQATCKYIYGELFQVMPFTGLLNYLSGLVKGVLSTPGGVINIGFAFMCNKDINTPGAASLAKICLANELVGMLSDVINDISNIKDDWTISGDYCENLEEIEDDEDDS